MTASPQPEQTPASKARYIMIGGFLGAGKTTSVLKLARRLAADGRRVGLITNDQGHELVDTAMLRAGGFATEEIAGGCFCCRFNSLMEAAARLTESNRPEIFIAEPVGSCTDLVATVTYPLRRIYGDQFSVAPLSVVIDPVRALRLFGIEPGPKFSQKVAYIYRKQLEEADLLVLNKADWVAPERLDKLRAQLAAEYPRARILNVSARTGAGLEAWFQQITTEHTATAAAPGRGTAMEVDYDLYAEGEALLGWLNATLRLNSSADFDGNEIVHRLAAHIQHGLRESGAEIAHLKMTLSPDSGLGDLAVVNVVRNDFVPELSQELPEPIDGGALVVNLRAEAEPEKLHSAVLAAIARLQEEAKLQIRLEHVEHFRPGRPQPTHRFATAAG